MSTQTVCLYGVTFRSHIIFIIWRSLANTSECLSSGGTARAQWEDVTGTTPLTFVKDCVSFTTTVSARFWLMDCRNVQDSAKMATELYREAIHVPFLAK